MAYHAFRHIEAFVMSESRLVTKIIDYLNSLNYWTVKVTVCNKKGVMDIIACAEGGRFVDSMSRMATETSAI